MKYFNQLISLTLLTLFIVSCNSPERSMGFTNWSDDGKEYKIFGEGGVEKTANEFNKNFLGKIPIHQDLRDATDRTEVELTVNFAD